MGQHRQEDGRHLHGDTTSGVPFGEHSTDWKREDGKRQNTTTLNSRRRQHVAKRQQVDHVQQPVVHVPGGRNYST